MKTMIEIIGDILNEEQEVVAATILSKKGSAPRGVGTKMLIRKNAVIVGTIGGGLLEAMTIQLASKVFKAKESLIEKFTLSDKDASLEGMVCGGNVEILLEYINEEEAKQYHQARELREDEKDFVMLTRIPNDDSPVTQKDKFLFTKTEFYGQEDEKVKNFVSSLRENFNQIKFNFAQEKEKYFIEPIYGMEQLCIVGAGHISQKVALFAKELGFYTVVMDDRSEFLNKEYFTTANELLITPSYAQLPFNGMINNNSYIVIVTRGHSFDKDVLGQALRTDAKYIGMIGSKKKKKTVYSKLLDEGFVQSDLDRVACPIGIPIDAQTPEEIAISILAELIKVKRG
ncbi:XdhC family aldehyde oxidoreductase maturation factor [Sulfurospirillum arcachonense]|uniref:XdhC family aldehyde oxidoreductase maturation factor n=1 Tax=Sulfurospirillum arcachonense TaxID=57666 RepID=UPI00046AAB26|nr:XdhC/CoxI family protein [Sulfurospirillum arcachonense]